MLGACKCHELDWFACRSEVFAFLSMLGWCATHFQWLPEKVDCSWKCYSNFFATLLQLLRIYINFSLPLGIAPAGYYITCTYYFLQMSCLNFKEMVSVQRIKLRWLCYQKFLYVYNWLVFENSPHIIGATSVHFR